MPSTQREAEIIGNYLIGKPIGQELINRYCDALETLDTKMEEKESRLWQKCLRNPLLISYIDSGMAIHNSFSKIRYRIYIMFCILETSPGHAAYFLPKKRPVWYIPVLLFDMAIAAFQGMTGYLIIKLFFNARNT